MSRRIIYGTVESLAFLLEVVALVVFAWWGATVGGNTALHVILAIAAPVAIIVVWGTFAAPRARVKLPVVGILVVKAIVFGAATAAFFGVGYGGLGVAFAVVAFIDTAVATYLRNEKSASSAGEGAG